MGSVSWYTFFFLFVFLVSSVQNNDILLKWNTYRFKLDLFTSLWSWEKQNYLNDLSLGYYTNKMGNFTACLIIGLIFELKGIMGIKANVGTRSFLIPALICSLLSIYSMPTRYKEAIKWKGITQNIRVKE